MNRPIKFRAWYHDTKKMVSVDLPRLELYLDKGMPVMQFTGLLDQNGEEIYEGDIVMRGSSLWAIRWQADAAKFMLPRNPKTHQTSGKSRAEFIAEWEVIGNIFENPELLKV